MNAFSNIEELIRILGREKKLLTEMFRKRKSLSYKYDYALALLDGNEDRIRILLDYSVIKENGSFLEIDDRFLTFFEQILEVNEGINVSYINQNIETIQENIIYYFNEQNDNRKYNYLRIIKQTFQKIGLIALRNVVDLRRNVEITFKSEPNYKNKQAKLEYLDRKSQDIYNLIIRTRQLIDKEPTFFKSAMDGDLNRIITNLKTNLNECTHNLIEIQKQIIDFLHQVKYQSEVAEKLRQIKYLRDQFTITENTNIEQLLEGMNLVAFESNPIYPLKLSVDFLLNDELALDSIKNAAKRAQLRVTPRVNKADKIPLEYLDNQAIQKVIINLEEVKNSFSATSDNLFDFIQRYRFPKEVSFEESVTLYCQIVSQYSVDFDITNTFSTKNGVEYALVYPK